MRPDNGSLLGGEGQNSTLEGWRVSARLQGFSLTLKLALLTQITASRGCEGLLLRLLI